MAVEVVSCSSGDTPTCVYILACWAQREAYERADVRIDFFVGGLGTDKIVRYDQEQKGRQEIFRSVHFSALVRET